MRIQLKLCMKRRVYLHLWDPIVTKKNSSCYWSEVRLEMRPLIPRSRQYTKPMIITRINKLAKPYSSTSNAKWGLAHIWVWFACSFDVSTFSPKMLELCIPAQIFASLCARSISSLDLLIPSNPNIILNILIAFKTNKAITFKLRQ
jgi:hypothetical protein